MDILLQPQFLSKLYKILFVVPSSVNMELYSRNAMNKLSDCLNCEIYSKPFCECSMIDKIELLLISFIYLDIIIYLIPLAVRDIQ